MSSVNIASKIYQNNQNGRSNRSFTLLDNRDFLPRPFQIELYEACKNRDTIVFLRPGQGKYFISVMLAKYFSPYQFQNATSPNNRQMIFFLAKSLNSIKLYYSVFNAHLNIRIGQYLNESKEWSKEEWKQNLLLFDLHLMFDETFEHLLKNNVVQMENINLLILDDVHKILLPGNEESDCYTRIIHKLQSCKNKNIQENKNAKCYRILGLSASILLEGVSSKIFEKMIDNIESNLGCSCETYADLRMINKYSIQSRIRLLLYPPLFNTDAVNTDNFNYKLALFFIRNYCAQFIHFVSNLSSSGLNDQVINIESIARIIIDILKVFGTLGEWCTLKLIKVVDRELSDTITLMSKTQSNYLRLLDATKSTMYLVRQCILTYLSADIRRILENNEQLTLEQFLSVSSPKLHILANVLLEYLDELSYASKSKEAVHSSFTFPANICSLIYAENRSMVLVLDEWLTELAAISSLNQLNTTDATGLENKTMNFFSHLLPNHVFLAEDDGKNEMKNFYYRKHQKSLHEIYYYRQQEEALRRFRLAHNCNILVTTSLSAEGLDVNRCNLVVCFDPPQTFHQFIQSKGRVRVEKGQFIVLVEESKNNCYQEKFQEFCNIEKIFTKLVPLNNLVLIEKNSNFNKFYVNEYKGGESSSCNLNLKSTIGNSEQQLSLELERQEKQTKPVMQKKDKFAKSLNTSNTMQLTLANAISILNRYCNKLPSDTFTKLVPNYKIEIVNESDLKLKYRCRLYLPINSTYRDEIVSELQENQSLAKQSAAFKAVKTLKDMGELDQNYYPVGKETSRYIEKLGLQDCFITKLTNNSQNSMQSNENLPLQNIQQPNSNNVQHSKGNRYNRIQNRNIASKRRQYYDKKVADSLCGQVFKYDSNDNYFYIEHLYQFEMKLTYSLSEKQYTRGRKIIDPAETSRTFGIIVANNLPPICDFTIYNRSGEVTISLMTIPLKHGNRLKVSEKQIQAIEHFHKYTFENVLSLSKSSISFDRKNSSNGNYLVVPIDYQDNENNEKSIDWKFIYLICDHIERAEFYNENICLFDDDKRFVFQEHLYKDSVVIPKYRKDKLQAFYYVAEICYDLTPLSPFPDNDYNSFEEYYRKKYLKTITNLQQPLLDVDHTSARLNLLTPRFNRKGTVTKTNHQSKRGPQQKQILVPELCYIHPFPASFWRKAVGLPCILYRLNLLLVAEELRFKIAKEANIGKIYLPEGEKWPKLDFGWSLLSQKSDSSIYDNQELPIINNSNFDEAVNNTVDNPNDKDAFSSMDDWTSFSTKLSLSDENDVKYEIPEQIRMQDTIEIISGPFNDRTFESVDWNDNLESELDSSFIVEVNNYGQVINTNSKQNFRIGSPTYLQRQFVDDDSKTNHHWKKWNKNSDSLLYNEFDISMESLRQELSCFISNSQESYFEYSSEDVNYMKQKNSNKNHWEEGMKKPLITSLSDLEDDVESDNDNVSSYSDFELNDNTDEDEDDDYDDINSEDDDNDVFDELDNFENDGQKCHSNNNEQIKILSKTLNEYQLKSLIYDVLKIELLYDFKQIEQRCLKRYYRHRFAISDQESDHLQKRKLFEEMYLEEKEQVMQCVNNVRQQVQLLNEHIKSSEIMIDCVPQKNIVLDFDLNDIKLKEPLINVLMDKIDPFLLEKFKMSDIDENDQLKQLLQNNKNLSNDNSEILVSKKPEVKFGELLPNRYNDLYIPQNDEKYFHFQRQIALQTLPHWLNDFSSNSDLNLGPHPSLILQAITMSNSSDGINLERLETVGDSFLKYSITAFLFCMCPELNEGKLSFLRSRQISNINLHRLGQRINLGQLMIASKFEPVDNWCPPSYQVAINTDHTYNGNKTGNKVPYNLLTQHSIPNKSIADCVEALIGTYLISSGSYAAIQFMDWLGLKVLPKGMKMNCGDQKDGEILDRKKWLPQPRSPLIIPKPFRNNCLKIQEIENKLEETFYKHHLNNFEEIVDYRFRDRAYLVQAFTHNSYYENTVTDCYQRLEFLGDAVLDYLITRYLYEDPRCHSPGTLTDLRSALVNNTFFAALAVKYNFHKYLMMLSSELYRVIDGFVRKFNIYYKNVTGSENCSTLDNEFDYNYWELFISENEAEHLEDIEVPKALGDIFESVAGAIYLDSGMSLEAVWKAYYPMMKPEIENFSDKVPKSPIRVLLERQPQNVKFGKPEITSGRRIRVTVELFRLGKFVGIGRNKRIAKCTAAKRALRALESDKKLKESEQRKLSQQFNQ